MWQKYFYLGFLLILSGMFTQTYAKTIEVVSLSDFSTANPPASITVKLMEPLELTSDTTLKAGVTVYGNLVDVVSPRRLKRGASFSFRPKSYTESDGKTHNITTDIVASYSLPIDKGNLAKSAALGVGNYFVKGLSVGVAAVEGAVNNNEDNRFKSSVVSAYESSPLSYIQKGSDLEVKKSQSFYLKFPDIEIVQDSDKKGQNYTYTIEKE